ncbi:MAG: DUF2130 domain-containing protein [Terriglobales bacterium]
MPNEQCPVCGQSLPEAVTLIQIENRLQKLALASPALAEERKRVQEEYNDKLVAERELARQRAERAIQGQLLEAKKRAEKAEQDAAERLKRVSKEYEGQLEREKESIKRDAERGVQAKISSAEKRAEKAERELAEKLEAAKQSAKRDAERDLRAEINSAEKRAEKAERELADKLEAAKQSAKREAVRDLRAKIGSAEKRAEKAERELAEKLEAAKADASRDAKRTVQAEIRKASELNERKLEKLQDEREKEKLRHEAEKASLQGQLDNLSRKLEKQSGGELGEEGESDLYTLLSTAFPEDRIERISKGAKGADIVQQVMNGGNILGRIVYESKNVLTWQYGFVEQAEKYRTRYDTPYVLIVSTAFPRKEKDFCIAGGIPVVRPRMAIALAQIIRSGIIEIGNLRLAGAGRDQKAQQLLEYIVGDKFGTRFKEIADGVGSLREQQQKDRNWHENAWEYRASLHERIENSHRGIDAQLKAVLTTMRPIAVAAGAADVGQTVRPSAANSVFRSHNLAWKLGNRKLN